MTHQKGRRPAVISARMQEAFELKSREMGLNPADRWIGGYVEYEWDHLRHIVAALPVQPDRVKILEFGCNVGASAILCSMLGATVTAIDISPNWVELARLNAGRYGVDNIEFNCVKDSAQLPYANGQFDLVICNSVLEYVSPGELRKVQGEIDRVLAPGGMILVTGTSNRLSPCEVHSRRWLANYVPRAADTMFRKPLQRGVWPWKMRFGFGSHYANLDLPHRDGPFAHSRRAMGMSRSRLNTLLWTGRLIGVSPGLLAPSIFCALLKRT